MYNALTGLGGSGQVDPTVAANATVALLSATAGTALFIVGPIFDRVGPRICLLLGGWTYPLYAGSLLCFNRTQNGAFVIASGAILGVGASFLWVSQGAIMTTYVHESQKGRAIAAVLDYIQSRRPRRLTGEFRTELSFRERDCF